MEAFWIEKANKWANDQFLPSNEKKEIQKLLENKDTLDVQEIKDRFYKDLEFGTGGLRGIIGAGTNRINSQTVRRITYAIGLTLKETYSDTPSVVVCYDSRKFSKEFAQEVCGVLAAMQIKTYLFSRLNPVALLSYAIRSLKAKAGVMITASHNPINYNGYKVYGENGGQVIPPLDKKIENTYQKLDFLRKIDCIKFDTSNYYINELDEEMEKSYHLAIKSKAFHLPLIEKNQDLLKIVYTPIHGTGLIPVITALNLWGFKNISIVQEQANPDDKFPTVKSPNPEDPQALSLAVNLMLKEKANIAFGTDPDTDRLGVVYNNENNPYFLNGNEIAILLLDYFLKQNYDLGNISKNSLVIKSIVTSPIQEKICKKYNINCTTTLTGFKWMCLSMEAHLDTFKDENLFIIASEESFGVLTHPFCRDKDAVAGITHFCEMVLYNQINYKQNILERLDAIYQEFGYHKESLITQDFTGPDGIDKMNAIMNKIRQQDNNEIIIENEKVIKKIDYLYPEQSETNLPAQNCLCYLFESGHRVFIRPSGTEPKIKVYFLLSFKYEDKATKIPSETEKYIQNFFRKYLK